MVKLEPTTQLQIACKLMCAYWKCNFSINLRVALLVGGRFVLHFYLKRHREVGLLPIQSKHLIYWQVTIKKLWWENKLLSYMQPCKTFWNKCSDRSIGIKTWNYDRRPTRPTDKLIWGLIGKLHFQQHACFYEHMLGCYKNFQL